MRNTFLFFGIGLIFLNVLAGLIFHFYSSFNCALSSTVLAFNYAFGHLMYSSIIKDGFKISFSFIFSFIGFLQFVISLFIVPRFENNHLILLLASLVLI